MKKNRIIYLFMFFMGIAFKSYSQNQVLKGWADPALKVWNGKLYLSVGKDSIVKEGGFYMNHWALFSTTDLLNWKMETEIWPNKTYLGNNFTGCFATDITFSKGKYYFYFSGYTNATGVLVADKPNGPYVDVLKKPVLPKGLVPGNESYDPTIFTDDDGLSYLIFGLDGNNKNGIKHYQIVKLNPDMVSLAEAPRSLITASEYGLGMANLTPDHNYFHKRNGIYYLSCGAKYVTSKNVYGPFSEVKNAGLSYNHTAFFNFNGQEYHAYNTPVNLSKTPYFRQINITYLNYKDNGDMVDDMNFAVGGKYYENGVGSYSAKWDTIQAEWFFKKSANALKKESPNGGFEIQNLKNDDFLNYPAVKDLSANATINFNLSSKFKGGKIEIREGSINGNLLGTCVIPKTGSFTTYKTASCKLKNKSGETDLYFVFKGAEKDLLHLDGFNFNK